MATTPLGDRKTEGLSNRQAHANFPTNTFERELGRDGFFGQSTHMYHQHPPTGWIDWQGPSKPRAFNCNHIQRTTDHLKVNSAKILNTPFDSALLLSNQQIQIRYWTISQPMESLCRNADGDWLLFIHEGSGDLFCDYGQLSLITGDYCIIPKGTLWRIMPHTAITILLIEATEGRYALPEKGILGQHAIFDPALLDSPRINDAFKAQYTTPISQDNQWTVIVKKRNLYSTITYPFNPLDAIGWHGDLMPTRINITQLRPLISHRYHLPPSAHTTFVAPGFVICTFTPRPFETDPDALKIPFFHNNDDYDEVLFYHQGDFMSRDHIEPGMITFHPAGFTHGPHPKALQNMRQQHKSGTNEYAVMIDSRQPLEIHPEATAIEDITYIKSWQNSPSQPSNTL